MIPHNKPTLGREEELASMKVLKTKNLSTNYEVKKFEDKLCKFLNIPKGHAVVCSSGTAALFLALKVLKAEKKKIAFPSYVCSALRHATGLVGGKEIIIDIEKNSPNTSMDLIKKSKADIAIIPHIYGLPIKFKNIKGMDVIEDCCHTLGAKVNKKSVGLTGKLGIFSFYTTKLITSGGHGGAVISKEKKLINEIRNYLNFDLRKDKKKRFNFKMTEIQAAIGRSQLKRLPKFLKIREKIFKQYKDAGIDLFDTDKKNIIPVRYRAIMKTKKQKEILKFLNKKKINTIVPLEDWELLGSFKKNPNAYKITKNTVSLPIYPTLKKKEQDKVIKNLKRFI